MQSNYQRKQSQFILASLTRNTTVAVARYTIAADGRLELLAVVAAAFRDGDDYYIISAQACADAYNAQLQNGVISSPRVTKHHTEQARVQLRLDGDNDFTREVETRSPNGVWFVVSFSKGTTTVQTEATMRQLHSESWRVARGASSIPFVPTMSDDGDALAVERPTAIRVLELAPVQGGLRDLEIVDDGRSLKEVTEVMVNAERLHAQRTNHRAPRNHLDSIKSKLSPGALEILNQIGAADMELLASATRGGRRRDKRGGKRR